MPTGFPRVVMFDPQAQCHVSVVVRRDKGYFKYQCLDHGDMECFDLFLLGDFKALSAQLERLQIVSWIEVMDDGS